MIRQLLVILLSACSACAGVKSTIVLIPKTWDHHSPLPVSVWLHGYGANPSRLLEDAHYQSTADTLKIAIVGVPATREVADASFVWTDVPDLDLEQVEACLAEAERRSGAHFTARALFGFSQGAAVAAEISARYPSRFVGAIILSPGSDAYPLGFDRQDQNSGQHFYISVGALEHPGNLDFARRYRRVLTSIGAAVEYREVVGMKEHNRPPDWPERFRDWTAVMLKVDVK